MNLLVISHKEVWSDAASPSVYSTIGGFPLQIKAISELFDSTNLIVALRNTPLPRGAQPIVGHNLIVKPLPEPRGSNLRRKLSMVLWLPKYLPELWRGVSQSDAVHSLVPGDIGAIGILVALLQKKLLLVRHCGTWGEPVTFADHMLNWLLERIAGGRNVILATGGADHLPSKVNSSIQWIFSTTIHESEFDDIPTATPWQPDIPLRLVTVSRLTPDKNTESVIRALPILQQVYADVHLSVVGDGESRLLLQSLVMELGIEKHVKFHGNLPHNEVLRILSESHLFVFPTRTKEGFPKAVVEAMACSLPIIATGISVIPDLIFGAGQVLKDTNPETVANAILDILSDIGELEEMGNRARKKAMNYTLERWQAQIASQINDAWNLQKMHQ